MDDLVANKNNIDDTLGEDTIVWFNPTLEQYLGGIVADTIYKIAK